MGTQSIANLLPGLTYRGATGHVFRFVHVREDLEYKEQNQGSIWTSPGKGTIFTYNDAVNRTIHGAMPDDGRWFAVGTLIYSVE